MNTQESKVLSTRKPLCLNFPKTDARKLLRAECEGDKRKDSSKEDRKQ